MSVHHKSTALRSIFPAALLAFCIFAIPAAVHADSQPASDSSNLGSLFGQAGYQVELAALWADALAYESKNDHVAALDKFKKASELSAANNDTQNELDGYTWIDYEYESLSKYDKVLPAAETGVKLAKILKDTSNQCRFLMDAAASYSHLRMENQSIATFQEALTVAKSIGNEELVATINSDIDSVRGFRPIGISAPPDRELSTRGPRLNSGAPDESAISLLGLAKSTDPAPNATVVHVDVRYHVVDQTARPNKTEFTWEVKLTGNCKLANVIILNVRNDSNFADLSVGGMTNVPVDDQWHTEMDAAHPTEALIAGIDKASTLENLHVYAYGLLDRTTTADEVVKPRLVAQVGHKEEIYCASFSPDGSKIVTCSFDRSVKIWERSSGLLLNSIAPGEDVMFAARFCANGTRIITGSIYGQADLWDATSGARLAQFCIPNEQGDLNLAVASVACSHNGNLVAVASWAGRAYLLDATSFNPLHTLRGHTDKVVGTAFSPDDRTLYTASWDGTVRIWNTQTGELVSTLDPKSGPLYAIAVFPDGKTIATGGKDNIIRIWDLATGKVLRTFSGHGNAVLCIAVSSDGNTLASGGADGKIKLWNASTGQCVATMDGAKFIVRDVSFSPDNKFLASGGRDANTVWDLGNSGYVTSADSNGITDETARIWDIGKRQVVQDFVGSGAQVESAETPAFGSVLAVRLRDSAYTFDLRSGGRSTGISNCGDKTTFSPDGKMIAYVSGTNDDIGLWDMRKESNSATLRLPVNSDVWQTCWSPDCRHFAASTSDGHIVIWNTGSAAVERIISSGAARLWYIKWSLRGNILAGMGDDYLIRTWDAASGALLSTLTATDSSHTPRVSTGFSPSYSISPDGAQVADCLNDGTIRIFDSRSGRQINALYSVVGPPNWTTLGYSPDGNTICTNQYPILALCWNAHTGEIVRSIYGNDNQFGVVGFSPDSRVIVTASTTVIQFWNAATGSPIGSMYNYDNGDWIFVAPDGRFDTNNLDGARELHWVTPDDTPLPLQLFMRQYYEPRLMGRMLAGETLPPAPDVASLYRERPTVAIDPQITADTSDHNRVVVKITVKQASGTPPTGNSEATKSSALPSPKDNSIRDLRLFRDGQLVGYAPDDADGGIVAVDGATGSRTYSFPVRIPRDGRKAVSFSAYAFNCDLVKSDTSTVTYTVPSPKSVMGKAYVISMGVNSYDDNSWNLRYCANDARLVSDSLVSRLESARRYSEIVSVPLISDDTGRHATKAIFKAVCDILAGHKVDEKIRATIPNASRLAQAMPEDMVIISFSCHGAADSDGTFFLFPSDIGSGPHGNLDHALKLHAISSGDLSYWLRDVDAGQLAMVIDACHSAASVAGLDFKPGPMDSRGLGQLAYDKGMRILAASQADNVAVESGSLGDGLLSYALAKDGLQYAQADTEPRDGSITLRKWLRYGVNRVPSLYDEIVSGKRDPFAAKDAPIHNVVWFVPKDAVQQPTLFDFSKSLADPVIVPNVGAK